MFNLKSAIAAWLFSQRICHQPYARALGRAKLAMRSLKLSLRLCFLVILAAAIPACGGSTAGDPPAEIRRVSTASSGVSVLPVRLAIPGLDRDRAIRIYLPPGYSSSSKRYPVLYMHDGQNLFDDVTAYAGEWGVDETLDGLAASGGLELIVVGIDNGGASRMTELNPWDNTQFGKGEGKQYMDFLVNKVKPMVDSNYRTLPDREHTGIMGSSMGGLISHYALLQYPQVFGMVGIFSPSYWAGGQIYEMTLTDGPAKDARIALYSGGAEHAIESDYRRMLALLQAQGHPSESLWFKLTPNAVHNESAWRAEFGDAVQWLFGRAKEGNQLARK